jgi:hypothetical protein
MAVVRMLGCRLLLAQVLRRLAPEQHIATGQAGVLELRAAHLLLPQ